MQGNHTNGKCSGFYIMVAPHPMACTRACLATFRMSTGMKRCSQHDWAHHPRKHLAKERRLSGMDRFSRIHAACTAGG